MSIPGKNDVVRLGMKIEAGKSYRMERKTVPVVCRYVSESNGIVIVAFPDGQEIMCQPRMILAEWSEPTPFEKAKEAWRNGAIGGVEEFYWNAALEHAISCIPSKAPDWVVALNAAIIAEIAKAKAQ